MSARNDRTIVTIRDVKRTEVVMEQLDKNVSSEKNTRNNREAVFSVLRSVPRGYKKDKEDGLNQLSSETPACQDMSLRAEELI
jgi:hypothetical protein